MKFIVRFANFLLGIAQPKLEGSSEYGTPLKLIPKGYWEIKSGTGLSLVTYAGGPKERHRPLQSWTPWNNGYISDQLSGYGWSGSHNCTIKTAPEAVQPWLRHQARYVLDKALDEITTISAQLVTSNNPYLRSQLSEARLAVIRVYEDLV